MSEQNELNVAVHDNFHSDDFDINKEEKKIRLKAKSIREYICSNTGIARVAADLSEQRRKLQVKDGFGMLHLDFTPTATTGLLFTLPDNAPTPTSLIEVQTYTGGLVWIEANTRQVQSSGLLANRRLILDLVGFFR